MEDAKRASKVAAVVFMGTPNHGAPQAFWAYLYGYNFGNGKISDRRIWEVSANWAGAYQLFPDYPFIEGEDGKMWSLDKSYDGDWISWQEYNHTLDKRARGEPDAKPTIGLKNTKFALDGIELHKQLGDTLDPYPGVSYYVIQGSDQNTLVKIKAELVDVGMEAPLLNVTRVEQMHGDGTVPEEGSAIKGADAYFKVNSSHGDIPNNNETQRILTMLRKRINDEDNRSEMLGKIERYVSGRLNEAKDWKPAQKPKSDISTILSMFFGKQDDEKVQLRDQIRSHILPYLEDSKVNILIGDEDHIQEYFMVIRGKQIVDAGFGHVEKGAIVLKIEDASDVEKITSFGLSLGDAVTDKRVKLEHIGFLNSLRAKIYQWVMKYERKK